MSSQTAPDPDHDKLASSCLDLLLIELVPLAYRIAADLHAKEVLLTRASAQNLERASLGSTGASTITTTTASAALPGKQQDKASTSSSSSLALPDRTSQFSEVGSAGADKGGVIAATTTTTTTAGSMTAGSMTAGGEGGEDDAQDDDEAREAVFWRLDALGYRVGQGLVERFSASSPRPNAPLDMIKFLCKDLWTLVFRKQIDNLKTNHRGTFVLTDSRFPPLARMSVDRSRGSRGLDEALAKAQPFLWFPCGVIRGALSGFGLNVTVQAETTDLKGAVFQIRTVGSKP